MQQICIAHGAEEQERIGAALAQVIAAPATVYLHGNLGAGKTTLVRGLLHSLGHAGPVKSPTYTLIEQYELPGRRVLHLDLYRLADPEELEFLGLRDLLGERTITLVEWPEMGAGWLPKADVTVSITHLEGARRLEFDGIFDRKLTF
jgi:tRNA threonylcarbamoyladenosine biosynthesis protein TsaE